MFSAIGKTLAFNPGSAHGFDGKATIAIFDTKTKKIEWMNLYIAVLHLKGRKPYKQEPYPPPMLDWDKQRPLMVQEQIQSRGITNKKILDAFLKTPRHLFIPEGLRDMSYEDHPVSIGHGQTISQPYIVALMTDRLELTGKEKVLEIGTGTGFQTSILSKLAKEVYSLEIVTPLYEIARELLKQLKRKNAKLLNRDGSNGYEAKAPYDRILVSAASKEVPKAFLKQLKVGGILILPIGNRFHQDLKKIRKTKEGFEEQNLCGCVFVPLVAKP